MNPLTVKFSKLHQSLQEQSFLVRQNEEAWKLSQQTLKDSLTTLRALEEQYNQVAADLRGEAMRATEDCYSQALAPITLEREEQTETDNSEPLPALETSRTVASPERAKKLRALPKKNRK